jgi:hypothetical protein
MALNQKHPPRPAMDLANMRQQGVRREINHLVASANFLAAYEAGGAGRRLWQAMVYCAGHHIPLWEWLAIELLVPFHRDRPATPTTGDE